MMEPTLAVSPAQALFRNVDGKLEEYKRSMQSNTNDDAENPAAISTDTGYCCTTVGLDRVTQHA